MEKTSRFNARSYTLLLPMNVEFVVYIYHMLSILIYGIDDQLSQR